MQTQHALIKMQNFEVNLEPKYVILNCISRCLFKCQQIGSSLHNIPQ
jgi:hypothetical protein